eukprot:Seg6072.2 transcript_id=Seg6072.2/GoldUCD/mRNA.D3Y31 product="hypothetical protein" protein_id=Seg6072.2/GoldUCD/D3Y31
MQSKGGYEYNCALSEAAPDGIDLSTRNENTEDNSKSDNENAPEQQNGQSPEDSSQPNRTDEQNTL